MTKKKTGIILDGFLENLSEKRVDCAVCAGRMKEKRSRFKVRNTEKEQEE